MKLSGKLASKNTFVKLLTWFGLILLFTVPTLFIWNKVAGPYPSVAAMKTLQAIQTFVLFIIPSLMAAWLWSDKPLSWLHMDKGMSWQTALLVPLMMVVFVPAINMLSAMNQQVVLPDWLEELEQMLKRQEEATDELTKMFARADTIPQLLLNLFIMAVLPAIGEEMCFRGTCQGLFDQGTAGPYNNRLRGRTHAAIWVTAFIFSAFHFQFYGFIPRMLLGAMLGYLLCMTGSLYVPMLAHFTNNTIAVGCYYLEEKGVINDDSIDTFGSGDTWWAGLLSLFLGCCLLWYVVRRQPSTPRP